MDDAIDKLLAAQAAALEHYTKANQRFKELRAVRREGMGHDAELEAFDGICEAIARMIPVEERYQGARADFLEAELSRKLHPLALELLETWIGRKGGDGNGAT